MDNKLKNKIELSVISLFTGGGMQERGIEDTGLFDINVKATSDISKEAVLAYATMHCGLTTKMIDEYSGYPTIEKMIEDLTKINLGYNPEKNKYYDWERLSKRKTKEIHKYWLACKLSNNLGDIKRINNLPYADLWTISFCCQDISIAGKMKGFLPDSGTRSSLLWENIRLLKEAVDNNKAPKYIMFENVKNLVSKKFIGDFEKLIDIISDLGYNSYWKVLNAKNCGVPQNRERVFCISVRKDIDKGFSFPKSIALKQKLRDIIDEEVEEKYYLSDLMLEKITWNKKGTEVIEVANLNKGGQKGRVISLDGICSCLTETDYKQPKQILTEELIQVGQIYGTKREPNPQAGRVYSADGLSSTLDTCQGGNRMPKIVDDTYANREPRVYENTSPMLRTNCGTLKCIDEINKSVKIRKLTPKECFRLMGLKDNDFNKCSEIGLSDSSLYKIAGNGLVTNCVEEIFEHLYKIQYDNKFICKDEKEPTNIINQEPSLLGGIGEKNFGNQYRQGNRIYDSNTTAMCLNAQPVGNCGGNSYLYLVKK